MASGNISMLLRTGNNEQSDECFTPKEAVLPLLPYLNKDWNILECTAWYSTSILDTLFLNGFVCYRTVNDFLTGDVPECDCIITNPPYSKKDAFIERCYELGKPFALLLPVSALQGQKRGKLFSKHGIELLVLNNRIDFTGKGAPHFGVAWFCWKILPSQLIFAESCKLKQ